MKKSMIFFCSFLLIAIFGVQIAEYIVYKQNYDAVFNDDALGDDVVTISITAVGDCFFGTDSEASGYGSFENTLQQNSYDYSYFFRNVKKYFETDDFTVINYEGCISDRGVRKDKEFAFRTNPQYVKILTESSIEVANIANNHSRDYGEEAFSDTKDHLNKNGIINFAASDVSVVEKDGIRIGFVGTNTQRYSGAQEVIDNINLVKEKNPDLIITVFHWGEERTDLPNEEQTTLAHLAIDNGADLVIGHHPHVLQGIEKYKGKYIMYSLGNFCFGGNKNPVDKDTMMFKQIFVFKDGKLTDRENVYVIPCSISSTPERNNYQPTALSGNEFKRVKNKIIERSKEFGRLDDITFIKDFD